MNLPISYPCFGDVQTPQKNRRNHTRKCLNSQGAFGRKYMYTLSIWLCIRHSQHIYLVRCSLNNLLARRALTYLNLTVSSRETPHSHFLRAASPGHNCQNLTNLAQTNNGIQSSKYKMRRDTSAPYLGHLRKNISKLYNIGFLDSGSYGFLEFLFLHRVSYYDGSDTQVKARNSGNQKIFNRASGLTKLNITL